MRDEKLNDNDEVESQDSTSDVTCTNFEEPINGLEKVKKAKVKNTDTYIAIFTKNFMQTNSYSPQVLSNCFKSWKIGQIVWDDKDIEMLLNINAPIEIYYKDVNRTAKNRR